MNQKDQNWETYVNDPENFTQICNDLRSPDASTRFWTVGIIRRAGNRDFIPYLVQLLWDDAHICREVVKTLCDFNADQYVLLLIALLSPKINQEIRITTAGYLGNLKSPEAILPLLSYVNASDGDMRSAVYQTLGRLVFHAEKPILNQIKPQLFPAFIKGIQDSHPNVREWSLYGLRVYAPVSFSESDFQIFLTALQKEKTWKIKNYFEFLEKSYDERILQKLLEMLKDPSNQDYFVNILHIFRANPDPRVAPEIYNFLNDKDDKIYGATCGVLGALKDQKGFELILELYKNPPSKQHKKYSLWTISEYQFPKSLKIVRDALNDESIEIRRQALYCLILDYDISQLPLILEGIIDISDFGTGFDKIEEFLLNSLFISDLSNQNNKICHKIIIATTKIVDLYDFYRESIRLAVEHSNFLLKEELLNKISI
jgi:hypothetical protein